MTFTCWQCRQEVDDCLKTEVLASLVDICYPCFHESFDVID